MRAIILLICLVFSWLASAQDAREIMRRSVSKDMENWELARDYTYTTRSVEKALDAKGKVKSTESEVREVVVLYGRPFEKLVQKNDKPLTAREAAKEEERLKKLTVKWANETDEERRKRLAKREKERREEREFLQEVVDAYDFRLAGEEKVSGKDAWVIQADPHPGYRAKRAEAKYLAKIRGKVWIDKAEYQWVKVDAETIDTMSFGGFVFRLYKGSRLEFEQMRVNDELWVGRRAHITAAGRLALVKREGIDVEETFDNYRKFQTDSRIVSAAEAK
jgi:hypothetical protein